MARFIAENGNGRRNGPVRLVAEGKAESLVCERCVVADGPVSRLRGLLGRKELPAGEGILLYPANAIHTWFMRFPIDAVFVDKEMTVLGIAEEMVPWRLTGRRGARAVVELAAGECRRRKIEPGDRLRVEHV